MPSKANNNGAAPLAQPPVRTLDVIDSVRNRVEAAHKLIDEEHPKGLTLNEVFNALIMCGLEAIEDGSPANGNGTTDAALRTIAHPQRRRCDQKSALAFLRWYLGGRASSRTVNRKLAEAIEMFAPQELEFINVENTVDPAVLAAFRAACRDTKPDPDVIERVYDDSVQEPLTASEQGRD